MKPVSKAIIMQRFGPLLGLAMLCTALGLLSDHFLTFDNLINVFRQSAVAWCFRSAVTMSQAEVAAMASAASASRIGCDRRGGFSMRRFS